MKKEDMTEKSPLLNDGYGSSDSDVENKVRFSSFKTEQKNIKLANNKFNKVSVAIEDSDIDSHVHCVPDKSKHDTEDAQTILASLHCHDSFNERALREKRKRKKALKKLITATVLSSLFMVGEVVGGYLANSLAVMTDASHLLSDVSSFLISILAIKMASKPTSMKMTFGWHRAEVIGALISVLTIWVVTGVLVYLAVMRIISRSYNVNGQDMLVTAGAAVAFNIVMGVVLHEHGHIGGHSHRKKSDSTSRFNGNSSPDSEESGNVNVRAAFIHVLGDLLQSIGVLTAAFIIYFKTITCLAIFQPEYKIADPICTFLFSAFILVTTLTILRDTMIIIMEGSPVSVEYSRVKEILLSTDEVVAVHDLRIWSLTVNQIVMSAHLVIEPSSDSNRVLKEATSNLKSFHDFHSLTLQIEHYFDGMELCEMCKPA